MKKLAWLTVLALVTGALAGCGSSGGSGSVTGIRATGSEPNPGTPEDRAAVMDEATRHPEFMDEALSASSAVISSQITTARGGSSVETAIQPVTFSRRVRVTARSFEFAFSDTDSTGAPTSAILTVHKDLTGTLRITAADTTGSFNQPVTISKPIAERWTRRLQFEREPGVPGGGDDDDRGHGHLITNGRDNGSGNRARWQLVAVSAIQITSTNGGAELSSLRVETAGSDTTLSDPLTLVPVADLPTVPPGAEVTVTATTSSADDIALLLASDRRFRLRPNGDGTHTAVFTIPPATGAQNFGVMVLSHETLYDDVAPYEAETWILPVRVGNSGLASAQ
jgi:hypothetical protein